KHEAGHLFACDNLKRGLMRACRDVMLIIACGRILDSAWSDASESAADEFAVQSGSKFGLDLASALVKIARMIPAGARPAMPASAFLLTAYGTSGFRSRVKHLLELINDPSKQKADGTRYQVRIWVCFVVVLTAFSFVAFQPHVLSRVHLL